jgi:hypothetical protein
MSLVLSRGVVRQPTDYYLVPFAGREKATLRSCPAASVSDITDSSLRLSSLRTKSPSSCQSGSVRGGGCRLARTILNPGLESQSPDLTFDA